MVGVRISGLVVANTAKRSRVRLQTCCWECDRVALLCAEMVAGIENAKPRLVVCRDSPRIHSEGEPDALMC